MARFKDANWSLSTGKDGKIGSWLEAEIAVLMDIRDELKRLNSVMTCQNAVRIPMILDAVVSRLDMVVQNTTPKKRKKAKRPVKRRARPATI